MRMVEFRNREIYNLDVKGRNDASVDQHPARECPVLKSSSKLVPKLMLPQSRLSLDGRSIVRL